MPAMPDRLKPSRRSFLTASVLAAPAAWLLTAGARAALAAPAQPSGTALAWHDITNQTVNAAAFPEPVTQSRTWAGI